MPVGIGGFRLRLQDVSTGVDLATEFETLNKAVAMFVEDRTEDDWGQLCPRENWPVGGVIRHIAAGYVTAQSWVNGFLQGKPIPIDQEAIDRDNDAHAADFAASSRAITFDLLVTEGAVVGRLIRGLTDEQLAIKHPVLSGRELTTAQLVKVLLRHTQGHFDNARSALGLA